MQRTVKLVRLATGIAWCAGLGGTSRADQQGGGADPPEVVVSELTGLRHGLEKLDDAHKSLLDKFRAEPARYAAAVADALRLPRPDEELASEGVAHRLGVALLLARELGPEHGRAVAEQFYEESSERRANAIAQRRVDPAGSGANGRWLTNLLLLRGAALDVLAALNDASKVNSVLDSIDLEDLATQTAMLRYLGQVARGDADAKQRLSKMVADPQSSLFRNQQAVHVLKDLESAPEKPNEQNPPSAPKNGAP